MCNRLTLLLLFSLTLSCWLMAQMSHPLAPGARGLAMGATGLTHTDIYAAWSNPAGVANLERTSFGLFAEQRFLQNDIRQVSAVGAIPTKSGTFGLVLGYHGFDTYNEQRFGVVYARKLFDNLRIGAQVYGFNARIAEYGSKMLLSFEIGAQMDISPTVSLGVRAANPVQIELVDEETLPQVFSLGMQYQPAKQIIIIAEVEQDILFPVRVRAGMEYRLVESLVLRAGVATGPALLSFGVGYQIQDTWQIDLATSYHQYLGFTPGISIVKR